MTPPRRVYKQTTTSVKRNNSKRPMVYLFVSNWWTPPGPFGACNEEASLTREIRPSLRVEVQISICRLSTFDRELLLTVDCGLRPTPDCRLWFETNSWLSTVVWDQLLTVDCGLRPTPDCRLRFETNSWLSTVVWDQLLTVDWGLRPTPDCRLWFETNPDCRQSGVGKKKSSTVENSRIF
jgi:hypothetical protein